MVNTKITAAIGTIILGRIAYKRFKQYREAVVPKIGKVYEVSDQEIDVDVSFLQDNKMKYAVDKIDLVSEGKVVASSIGKIPKGASSFVQRFSTALKELPEDLAVQVKYNLLGYKPVNEYNSKEKPTTKAHKCGCGCE